MSSPAAITRPAQPPGGACRTTRKRRRPETETRREIETAEARFRGLLDSAPDGILTVNAGGRITLINAQVEAMFGYQRDELVGQPIKVLIPASQREPHVRHRAAYSADPRRRAMGEGLDLAGRRKDGSEFPAEISLSPLVSDDGGATIAVIRDVSERRRLAATLRESHALLQAVIDGVPDHVFVKDLDGRYTIMNRAIARFLDLPSDRLLGRHDDELFSPAIAAGIVGDDRDTLASGEARTYEEPLVSGDRGGVFLTTKGVHRDAAGQIRGVFGISRDITELKRIEGEILRLNVALEERVVERTAELEAANRELEAFAYSVSHDLRAPLRAIDGFARILSEDFAPELSAAAARLLGLVRTNAQQMGRLVDDLLAFSRLARQHLAKSPIDPTAIARAVAAELLVAQPARSIELSIGELPGCEADPALLRQVFVNLLDNAIKYTRGRDPATIAVSGRSEGGQVVYAVRDNGAGFDRRYAGKLFGVFQRLHRAEEFEGTGVGLAIVQRVIHRHGGQVGAEGEVDRGAIFWFTLPASPVPPPATPRAGTARE